MKTIGKQVRHILIKIDTTKDFKLEIAGGKTYTSYKEAENDKLVGFDGEKILC